MGKHTVIPCPVCKGTGKKFDTNIREYVNQECTACRGSKIYDSIESVGGPKADKRRDFKIREELMSKSTSFFNFAKLCRSHGFAAPSRNSAYSLRGRIKGKGGSLSKW